MLPGARAIFKSPLRALAFGVAALLLSIGLAPPLAAQPLQLILLRHGDKDPSRSDYNLSPKGFLRAIALGRLLPACFGPVERIGTFELNPSDQQNARSYQTAVPLAVATGVPIQIFWGSRDDSSLVARQLLEDPAFEGRSVVLFWEHQRMPLLAQALGWPGMEAIDDNDFDQLILLRFSGDTPGSPQVQLLSQRQLFKSACFRKGLSPLPTTSLP
jgi:hypothetical protein